MEKAIKKAIPWNKGKILVADRKCDSCSRINRKVCFYPKWNMTLCQKHYWHMRHWGEIRWGDERPYKTPEPRRTRHTLFGIAWRKSVYERDNFTCQECGARGVKLEADHIKPFKYFPELRYLLSNGRTLCVPCHRKTPTWGRRGQKLYGESITISN